MAKLSYTEKETLEELFEMPTGYVMDFSNNSFARFVGSVVNIDIYNGANYQEYSSKANKLRQIWNSEPDSVVGLLLRALLDHCEDYRLRNGKLSQYEKEKIADMRVVAERLCGNVRTVELPQKKEETLATLLEDINESLARNHPELVLDRLHTFSAKLLRHICEDNNIAVADSKGNYYPLHSLAGMIRKKYEQMDMFQSGFTVKAIQNSVSLFDEYNAIRNDKSYAHDNEVLDKMEAEFAVKIMADLITFIDKAESYRKLVERQKAVNEDEELPF